MNEKKNKYKVANLVGTVNTDINIYKDRDCVVSDLCVIVYKAGGRKNTGNKLACGTTPGGTIHIMDYENSTLWGCTEYSLCTCPGLHSKTDLSLGHGSDTNSVGCEQINSGSHNCLISKIMTFMSISQDCHEGSMIQ